MMPTLVVFACMLPGFGLFGVDAPAGALTWLGFAICIAAASTQLVADTQSRRFRAAHPGRVCDSGLWMRGRHDCPLPFHQHSLDGEPPTRQQARLRGVPLPNPHLYLTHLITPSAKERRARLEPQAEGQAGSLEPIDGLAGQDAAGGAQKQRIRARKAGKRRFRARIWLFCARFWIISQRTGRSPCGDRSPRGARLRCRGIPVC